MFEWFYQQYQSNEFLLGTTVPVALAALAYWLRSLWLSFIETFKLLFSGQLRSNSDSSKHREYLEFVTKKIVWDKFRRRSTIETKWDSKLQKYKIISAAGYGTSWGFYKGFPVKIVRVTEKSDAGNWKEFMEVIIFSWSPGVYIKQLVSEFENYVDKNQDDNMISIYKVAADGELDFLIKKPKRRWDTLRINTEIKEKIINHLEKFKESREICEQEGIPWHTGILIHGKPGTGKTSLTHIIASHMSRDIAFFTKGDIQKVSLEPESQILSIEDIDVAGMETNRNNSSMISTFSEVLNFFDSFITPHGMITIATTNHIDRLDPALIRPGRFDLVIDMDKSNERN